ncbi:hypothetical protein GV828_11285 [Flavobacterium sp. NST-5]|uniref:Uncharacterized protein n=1 Tax=Flavobacterium ichthyis TaxID=2698827 RepID=A0ABW9ZA57_9FLAO|nr:hypothetical protein [Flavobacterium ichthyis]NBL65783.1 hypothetical protein [Flavobacterium ichthyis]
MKSIKVLVTLLLVTTILSCKNEGKDAAEKTAEKPNVYTFTLNAVVQQNDDFQIFFKEDNNPETPFEEVNSVWSGIKGGTNAQDVIFTLPEDVFPTQIRFDFGQNKTQPGILVNNFRVAFKDKTFDVKGADFTNYFIPDEKFVKFDKATSLITPIVQENGAYDPMFFSNGVFNEQLVKLSK